MEAIESDMGVRDPATIDHEMWVSKTLPDFAEDLLELHDLTEIRPALEWLVAHDYVLCRQHPRDHTWQYQLHEEVVQAALDSLEPYI